MAKVLAVNDVGDGDYSSEGNGASVPASAFWSAPSQPLSLTRHESLTSET